jgi:hypothetical protein
MNINNLCSFAKVFIKNRKLNVVLLPLTFVSHSTNFRNLRKSVYF